MPRRPVKPEQKQKPKGRTPDAQAWIYGRHAAAAALQNPKRRIEKALATANGAAWAAQAGAAASFQIVRSEEIEAALPAGATHQGLALLSPEPAQPDLDGACAPATPSQPVVVLDQISDPQNIGAIFRSAAAFGARAVIGQDRRTPPLAGVLAKAAAGAVERLPCVRVVNISRTLKELKEMGYLIVGLAGQSDTEIGDIPGDQPIALVLGAEGAGLRRLTRRDCDVLARIPIDAGVESLNVSNAAAVALYALRCGR
ncbi:MAG: 23S rRNA (guanosine(2251)-2'-O)-methyltransferase RlmB [Pseudomonadota bacterium]